MYAFGLAHGSNAPPSSLHSNVLPASVEMNVKVAFGEPLGLGGCDVIVVSGATTSTVHVRSVVPLSLFAASTALTRNVWEPLASPV